MATVVLILAIAWITSNNFENEKLPVHDVTRMDFALNDELRSAQRAFRESGVDAMKQRMDDMQRLQHRHVCARCRTMHDVSSRHVPQEVLDAAQNPVQDSEGFHYNRLRVRKIDQRRRQTGLHRCGELQGIAAAAHAVSPAEHVLDARAVAMVISAVFSLLLAAYITAPLARIRSSARRVARGDLSARVGKLPFGRSAEILALANEFDQMAARLKDLVEGQQRLIRDVSHEMRSPLSRLRVALELARDTQPTKREPTRSHRARSAAAGRNDRPVDSASRMETTAQTRAETIALDELVADIAADAAFERKRDPCSLHIAQTAPLRVHAEADLLTSAIENVVRNAVTYTAPAARSTCVWTASKIRRACACAMPARRRHRRSRKHFRTVFPHRRGAPTQKRRQRIGIGHRQARHRAPRRAHPRRNADGGGLEVEIRVPLA